MSLMQIHKSKTDKLSDKWESYLIHYEKIFFPLQNDPIVMAEIGIQHGGSLETWAKYFYNAQKIVGVDIDPRCSNLVYDDPRIEVYIQDAKKPIVNEYDIVIDDGSHLSDDMIEQFKAWFPLVKENGIYIVEDLHTMWMNGFGSDALKFFSSFINDVNREFSGSGYEIASMEFRNSLIVITKGKSILGERLTCGNQLLSYF